ncbi:hypothetical protein V2J09_004730 [Rumex salicifolius]
MLQMCKAGSSSQEKRVEQFFKIIEPHNLEDEGTLEIPPGFVSKYCNFLKRHVFLKVPNGAAQKVELKRSNGRVWLQKGWQDFVDLCSIDCWYFLVFRYEAESIFHVLVFDPSCSEIKYPVHENDDDESDDDETDDCVTTDPLERANAFQSPNPHFIVQMPDAYIHGNYLHVPKDYAKSYIYGRENRGNLEFIGPDGKLWMLKYYMVGPAQVRIGLGWGEFVRGYDLQVGDVCVFELVDVTTTISLSIYKVSMGWLDSFGMLEDLRVL